jgi:hypothetical protein
VKTSHDLPKLYDLPIDLPGGFQNGREPTLFRRAGGRGAIELLERRLAKIGPHSPIHQITPNAIRSISARNCAECGVDICNPAPQAVNLMLTGSRASLFALGRRTRDDKDSRL